MYWCILNQFIPLIIVFTNIQRKNQFNSCNVNKKHKIHNLMLHKTTHGRNFLKSSFVPFSLSNFLFPNILPY